MALSEELQAVIRRYDLLEHPFYQAWNKGQLTLDALRLYAAQYFAQVSAFPRWVSGVHSRCPDLPARKVLLENLVDEELHGTDHPTLWEQFSASLDVSAQALAATTPLPQTQATVDTFYRLTEGRWTDGLCALYAYESQVPRVSQSKIDGLKAHYGIADERGLAFFTAHLAYDVEHSSAVAGLIDRHAEPTAAHRATEEAARALWGFLDGVCHAAGVTC